MLYTFLVELLYSYTLFQTVACLLGFVGCVSFALSLTIEENKPLALPARLKEFFFNLQYNTLPNIGKLSYKQAIARAKFCNNAKNKKTNWLAIVRIIGGNKKEFMVIREHELESLRRVFSLDSSDKVEII